MIFSCFRQKTADMIYEKDVEIVFVGLFYAQNIFFRFFFITCIPFFMAAQEPRYMKFATIQLTVKP